MEKIKLIVNEALANYMGLLAINIESRKDMLSNFIAKLGSNNILVKEYMKEYYIYDAKYKQIQNTITSHITELFPEISEWSMDFNTLIVTLTLKSELKEERLKEIETLFNSGLIASIDNCIVDALSDIYNESNFTDENGIVKNEEHECSCENHCCDK